MKKLRQGKIQIDYNEITKRRKTIEWFSDVKLSKLIEKSYKGTWENISIELLLDCMQKEIDELKEAIKEGNHREIIRECADVSNFVMFIADKYKKC